MPEVMLESNVRATQFLVRGPWFSTGARSPLAYPGRTGDRETLFGTRLVGPGFGVETRPTTGTRWTAVVVQLPGSASATEMVKATRVRRPMALRETGTPVR